MISRESKHLYLKKELNRHDIHRANENSGIS